LQFLRSCATWLHLQRDVEHLVTCSYDGSVAIWDVRSGDGLQPQQLSRWAAHGHGHAAAASRQSSPACLNRSSSCSPAQEQAQQSHDTVAASQDGSEHLHLQAKDTTASVPAAVGKNCAGEDLKHGSTCTTQQEAVHRPKFELGTTGVLLIALKHAAPQTAQPKFQRARMTVQGRCMET
jgi:hypothetical protein